MSVDRPNGSFSTCWTASRRRERGLTVCVELVMGRPGMPELTEARLDEDSILALLRRHCSRKKQEVKPD